MSCHMTVMHALACFGNLMASLPCSQAGLLFCAASETYQRTQACRDGAGRRCSNLSHFQRQVCPLALQCTRCLSLQPYTRCRARAMSSWTILLVWFREMLLKTNLDYTPSWQAWSGRVGSLSCPGWPCMHSYGRSYGSICRVIARVRPPTVVEQSSCIACLLDTTLEVVSQV